MRYVQTAFEHGGGRGDALMPLTPEHPLYSEWVAYFEGLGIQEAAYEERQHPRDRRGRWRKTLAEMTPGQTIKTPDMRVSFHPGETLPYVIEPKGGGAKERWRTRTDAAQAVMRATQHNPPEPKATTDYSAIPTPTQDQLRRKLEGMAIGSVYSVKGVSFKKLNTHQYEVNRPDGGMRSGTNIYGAINTGLDAMGDHAGAEWAEETHHLAPGTAIARFGVRVSRDRRGMNLSVGPYPEAPGDEPPDEVTGPEQAAYIAARLEERPTDPTPDTSFDHTEAGPTSTGPAQGEPQVNTPYDGEGDFEDQVDYIRDSLEGLDQYNNSYSGEGGYVTYHYDDPAVTDQGGGFADDEMPEPEQSWTVSTDDYHSEEIGTYDNAEDAARSLAAISFGKKRAAEQEGESFEAIFDGFSAGGLRVSMNNEYDTSYGEGKVSVSGVIYDEKTDQAVGEIRRTLNTNDDSVYHDLLTINEGHRDGGFATALTLHSVDEYRKRGLQEVRVHASLDTGGYTWAALGFDFDSSQTGNYIATSNRAKTKLKQAVEAGYITQDDVDNFTDQAENGKFEHAWDLADAGRDQAWEMSPAEVTQSPGGRWAVASDGISLGSYFREGDARAYAEKYNEESAKKPKTMWMGKLVMLGSDWSGVLPLTPEAEKRVEDRAKRPKPDVKKRQKVPPGQGKLFTPGPRGKKLPTKEPPPEPPGKLVSAGSLALGDEFLSNNIRYRVVARGARSVATDRTDGNIGTTFGLDDIVRKMPPPTLPPVAPGTTLDMLEPEVGDQFLSVGTVYTFTSTPTDEDFIASARGSNERFDRNFEPEGFQRKATRVVTEAAYQEVLHPRDRLGRWQSKIALLGHDRASREEAVARNFEASFEGFSHGGLTSYVKNSEQNGPWLHVEGYVENENGDEVGSWDRSLNLTDGTVAHNLMSMVGSYQGRGFGTAFTAHEFDNYRRQGYTAVKIDAGSTVGGYAWAKMGFEFSDDKQIKHLLNDRMPGFEAHIEHDVESAKDEQYRSEWEPVPPWKTLKAVRADVRDFKQWLKAEPHSPQEIAAYGHEKTWKQPVSGRFYDISGDDLQGYRIYPRQASGSVIDGGGGVRYDTRAEAEAEVATQQARYPVRYDTTWMGKEFLLGSSWQGVYPLAEAQDVSYNGDVNKADPGTSPIRYERVTFKPEGATRAQTVLLRNPIEIAVGGEPAISGVEVGKDGEEKAPAGVDVKRHVISSALVSKRTPMRMNLHYGELEQPPIDDISLRRELGIPEEGPNGEIAATFTDDAILRAVRLSTERRGWAPKLTDLRNIFGGPNNDYLAGQLQNRVNKLLRRGTLKVIPGSRPKTYEVPDA